MRIEDASGAIRYALSQLGKPYLWGAIGPDSYDCSGLMQTAYKKGTGISIPRTTYEMLDSGSLQPVNQGQLQPGDLVFPSRDHVQMYLGGGKVVEAPHSGVPVRVTTMGKFYAGRRVTNPAPGDWAGTSPVSSTTQVDDVSGSTTVTASDVSQAVGAGFTNSFASIFQSVGSWIIWSGEIALGFILAVAGMYFIAGRQIMAGINS